MLDTERAFNENIPDELEASKAQRKEQVHDTPTYPTLQIDTKNEPDISAEQDLPTAPRRPQRRSE